jgi:hypothetical protein
MFYLSAAKLPVYERITGASRNNHL